MKVHIRLMACIAAAMLAVPAVGQGFMQALPASQPTTATSQPTATPAKPMTPGQGEWTFTVTAADQPKPALRYTLFTMPLERKPGNAVLMLDVAIARVPPAGEENKGNWSYKYAERIDELLSMPLEKIRAAAPVEPGAKGPQQAAAGRVCYPVQDEIQTILGFYGGSLEYTEIAASRRDADWGLPYEKGFSMQMPSLASLRQIARVLALKARLEIARGEYGQAVKTLQVGYAAAEHTGGPTLINGLVAVAMDILLNQQVMTMMQQPGSPNLYWAMAQLPRPMGGIQQGIQYERNWIYDELPELRDYKNLSADQWRVVLQRIDRMLQSAMDSPQLLMVAMVAANVGRAKEYLAENGYTPEQIKKMSPSQMVGIYFMDQWTYWWDENYKWWLVPYGQSLEGAAKSQEAMQKWIADNPASMVGTLMPSLARARTGGTRLERAVASMMVVEAIRMYAARNGGKPPATLADLGAIAPAPNDPMTDKPFEYKADGQTFVLRGVLPKGGDVGRDEFKYTVTIVPQTKGATNAK